MAKKIPIDKETQELLSVYGISTTDAAEALKLLKQKLKQHECETEDIESLAEALDYAEVYLTADENSKPSAPDDDDDEEPADDEEIDDDDEEPADEDDDDGFDDDILAEAAKLNKNAKEVSAKAVKNKREEKAATKTTGVKKDKGVLEKRVSNLKQKEKTVEQFLPKSNEEHAEKFQPFVDAWPEEDFVCKILQQGATVYVKREAALHTLCSFDKLKIVLKTGEIRGSVFFNAIRKVETIKEIFPQLAEREFKLFNGSLPYIDDFGIDEAAELFRDEKYMAFALAKIDKTDKNMLKNRKELEERNKRDKEAKQLGEAKQVGRGGAIAQTGVKGFQSKAKVEAAQETVAKGKAESLPKPDPKKAAAAKGTKK